MSFIIKKKILKPYFKMYLRKLEKWCKVDLSILIKSMVSLLPIYSQTLSRYFIKPFVDISENLFPNIPSKSNLFLLLSTRTFSLKTSPNVSSKLLTMSDQNFSQYPLNPSKKYHFKPSPNIFKNLLPISTKTFSQYLYFGLTKYPFLFLAVVVES